MRIAIHLFCAYVFVGLSTGVQAQSLQKIKDGDKLNYTIADYVAKGRDVVLEADRPLAVSISEKDATYTLKSELSTTLYQRKNHAVQWRETPQGVKTEVPSEQQFNWMPPQGDFSKPWSVSFVTTHPQCGNGKVTHEATAKPIKYVVQMGGKATELAVFEASFVGKWDFNNHCRSGKQLERWVYSPELDFVLERDQQNFNAQGFLNRGNNVKLKSVN
jgi:hypothetical protein